MDMYSVALNLDPKGIEAGAAKGEAAFAGLGTAAVLAEKVVETSSDVMREAMGKLGAVFAAAALGERFVEKTIESQNAMSQLTAAVKSTGGAAQLTVSELDEVSESMQKMTTYSEDVVKGAESILLTFSKVKGDQFKDATMQVANLATRMGGDMTGAALQLGKALQDPDTGLLALRRSGISFTKGQQEVIKALFDTGQEAKAQQMILAELEHQVGGSAVAARDTLGGALKGLLHSFDDLFKGTKETTSGVVEFINSMSDGLDAYDDNKDAIKEVVKAVGALTAAYIVVTGVQALAVAPALVSFLFGVSAAFAAAAEAGTGFGGVMSGLNGLFRTNAVYAFLQSMYVGIAGAFTTASAAGTGLTGVIAGLDVVMAGTLAVLGPIALAIGGAIAIWLVYKKTVDDVADAEKEADDKDQDRIRRVVARAHARAEAEQREKVAAKEAKDRADELATKVDKAAGAREEEAKKIEALNAAYGQADLTQKELGITYDAMIQKAKDRKEYHGAELAALDRATDATARAKIQALELADARDRADRLRGTEHTNAVATTSAAQSLTTANMGSEDSARAQLAMKMENDLQQAAYDLAEKKRHATQAQIDTANAEYDSTVKRIGAEFAYGNAVLNTTKEWERGVALRATLRKNDEAVTSAQDELDLAKQQVTVNTTLVTLGMQDANMLAKAREEHQRTNELLAAKLDLNEKLLRASTGEAIVAIAEYNATVRRINAVHDLHLATMDVNAAMQRGLEIQNQISNTLDIMFNDIGKKGSNAFQEIWDNAKSSFFRMVSDIIASNMMEKLAGVLGLKSADPQTVAAAKQTTAGTVMNTAADKQLEAAKIMANAGNGGGGDGTGAGTTGTGTGAVDAQQSSRWTKAGQVAGIAVAGYGIGYGLGENSYSTSHGAFGNYARGGLEGAAGGALAGAQMGAALGPVGAAAGAAIGAVAGFVGGLMGTSKAAKEAAKAMAELQQQVALNMDARQAQVFGDSLGEALAQEKAYREQQRKLIEDAYSGGGADSDQVRKRNAALAEMNAIEDKYVAALKEEDATKRAQVSEDLQVRLLRAQGHGVEADALALQLQQERERASLIKSFGESIDPTEAATLALLDQVQAQEKLAAAASAVNTQTLNMVNGYRLQAAIYAASGGQTSGNFQPTGPTPTPISTQPVGLRPGAQDVSGSGDLTVPVMIDGREVGRATLKDFKRRARKSGNSNTANILELNEAN